MFLTLLALTGAASAQETMSNTPCDNTFMPVGAADTCFCYRATETFWWNGNGGTWGAVDPTQSPADVTDTCFEVDVVAGAIVDNSDHEVGAKMLRTRAKQYIDPDNWSFSITFDTTTQRVTDQSLMSMDDGVPTDGPVVIAPGPLTPWGDSWEVLVGGVTVITFAPDGPVPIEAMLTDLDGDGILDFLSELTGGESWWVAGPLDATLVYLPPL